MKKNLHKLLALTLSVILATGLLTACSSDDTPSADTPSTTTDGGSTTSDQTADDSATQTDMVGTPGIAGYVPFEETVTLRFPVYDRGENSLQPVDNNFWTDYLQEKFGDQYNINLEFVPIERWNQMVDYALLAAGGILPTFLMEYDYWRLATWVNDGYMRPFDMNEFAFVAPDYYNRMVEDGQIPYSQMQGDTYFVLADRPFWNTSYRFLNFVRMDWLREVGFDRTPVGWAEETEAARLIKEAGLCTYPFGGFAITGIGSDQNYGMRGFPMDEEEWARYSSMGVYTMGWEPAKEFLRRENVRFAEGLMHPEFFIRTEDDQMASFINGEIYRFGGYMASTVDFLLAFYEQNPGAELAVLPVLTEATDMETPVFRTDNPFGMTIGFSSQATDDEIKAAWMMLEWMSQDDNLFEFSWGFEGEHWEYDEEGYPVSYGEYTGSNPMGFNSNKDYWCIAVESRVVGTGTAEHAIRANAPQGLPQDFYPDMMQVYYDQEALSAQGYGIIDPLFAEVIEAEAEYREALSAMYIEYRDRLIMTAPEEFSALYDELSEHYKSQGFQEIADARAALYHAGQSTHLPEAARK